MRAIVTTKLAALALLIASVPALSHAQVADSTPAPSPDANVRESRAYDQLLQSNPGFRSKRAHDECGSIADTALREQCLSSFPAGTAGQPATHRQKKHHQQQPQG